MDFPWRGAADGLVADLRTIFGSGLRAVVAYGDSVDGKSGDEPLACLALVEALTATDLEACARRAAAWSRQGIATPLVIPEQEFRRSLDAFPLEYAEIMRAHARVYGDDPFQTLSVAAEDLRRAIETQAKSHLLHLREGFIESGGRPRDVAALVAASAPAFAALLRNVARLHGVAASDRATATREGGRLCSLPEGVLADVLALEQARALPSADPARLFPDYLAAAEQLARFVDTWQK